MSAHHAVVWLDHNEAKVFKFVAENVDEVDLHAASHPHLHNRHAVSGRHEVDDRFLSAVAESIADASEFLVVGPAQTKTQFVKYLHKHHPQWDAKLIGVETVDHPTDRQIVAYAKKYFVKADRMR